MNISVKSEYALAAILDHTTFADLARRWTEARARYVPNWQI